MTSDGASIHTAVGRSLQREVVDRGAVTPVTIRDQVGAGRGSTSSLPGMDPEPEVGPDPDLDAIARDLAAVEAELERLADGISEDDEAPGSSAP
jgi:hypothetical protein